MADLGVLPPELLGAILAFAVHAHPRPASVLVVSRAWAVLSARALHAHLAFRGARALAAFAAGHTPLAVPPRTFALAGSGDDDVFDHLCDAFTRCRSVYAEDGAVVEAAGPVELDELALCLHSHAQSTRLHVIRDALALVNPTSFSWTGPDPDHHFSTAIVPEAAHHLLHAFPHWTRLAHLSLSNLALGAPVSTAPGFADTTSPPLIPAGMPALRTLRLARATSVPAGAVAALLALPGMAGLARVALVDVYPGSIWGARLRRGDVERVAQEIEGGGDALVQRVREVVGCWAATERIVGGDRAEGTGELV